MLVRDNYGIVQQHDIYNQNALDAGDSARTTGLLAMCGSVQDRTLISYFVNSQGFVRRHPYDAKWSDPALTSRDQVDCVIAGLYAISSERCFIPGNFWEVLCRKVFYAYAKRFFFVNSDVLLPDRLGSLVLAGRIYWLFPVLPLSYVFLIGSILWNCYLAPDSEQNQLISRCSVHGKAFVRLLDKLHPALEKNLRAYWGGWRDQIEVAEALIAFVKSR